MSSEPPCPYAQGPQEALGTRMGLGMNVRRNSRHTTIQIWVVLLIGHAPRGNLLQLIINITQIWLVQLTSKEFLKIVSFRQKWF